MSSNSNPGGQNNIKGGESRRSFLTKLGIGAAALALVASSLSTMRGLGSNNDNQAKDMEFPGEDSIFHPVVDPRQDPRRPNNG